MVCLEQSNVNIKKTKNKKRIKKKKPNSRYYCCIQIKWYFLRAENKVQNRGINHKVEEVKCGLLVQVL